MQRRLGVTTLYVTHDHDEAMAMGDRLAVMRQGRIEQCGVPIEVYDHPCNLFVAQFVGTPSMNVVRATIVESNDSRNDSRNAGLALLVGPHRVPLDDAQVRRRPLWRRLVGRDIAVGMRPDALRRDRDGPLVGSVRSTEVLDRHTWVAFDLDAPAVRRHGRGGDGRPRAAVDGRDVDGSGRRDQPLGTVAVPH